MIDQKQPLDQLPKEIKPAFQELKVLKHLNAAGFKKKFGFTVLICFILFSSYCSPEELVSPAGESNKCESFPGKDTVYRES